MKSVHRQLLDAAVSDYLPNAEPLREASVCITGASGFLAASLVAFLSELDRRGGLNLHLFANARRPLADVALFRFLELVPKVVWTVAAVEDVILPETDNLIVVHAASPGSPRDYLRAPLATYRANTQGLLHLFGQGRRLRQFVYISSAEVYGQPPDNMIPTPESYVGGLDTLSVRSIYGESKRMAEVLGVCLGEQQGVPFTALRPWNVYGPGQRLDDGRVPMEFIRQAKEEHAITLASNGTPRRAFCHAWDAVRQIAVVLGHTAKSAAFNIGNGSEEISMLELARRCAESTGLAPERVAYNPDARPGGLQRCAPDTTAVRARQAPAFTSLTTGLATLVEWHDFLTRS